MEKQTAEERRRKWQWQTADGAHALVKSCLGATLWPCGVYSRTSSRLSSSLAGLGTIYDQGYCNPDGMSSGHRSRNEGKCRRARANGQSCTSRYLLEHDALYPSGTSRGVPRLDSDPATAQPAAASRHKLTDDQAAQADVATRSHLQGRCGVGDQAAALATKHTGREHRLEANQAVGTPRREEPQALKDEPTVAAARSDGGAAHGLDHDVKVDSASLDARHGLRSDKELKTKLPVKKPQASGGG
ncbi:hypothetical protein OCS_02092 [Ophiocordyceps sinensis CO18]|uniref:Uncharacterized protein n=1 Tax=Ophiocordyceps sinensis (strain Co18 / CGMCC 3.14243) TaxID=911162 RepID=T5AK61_OPHSC|nr:hypothetical protein OCS_02092 [Ophiocordyceps sinensis CO18]